jgi:hypothetical protein
VLVWSISTKVSACAGETDQLDPLTDKSGFKDAICVVCA